MIRKTFTGPATRLLRFHCEPKVSTNQRSIENTAICLDGPAARLPAWSGCNTNGGGAARGGNLRCPCLNEKVMDEEISKRLEKIESELAHLEHSYDALNAVVI